MGQNYGIIFLMNLRFFHEIFHIYQGTIHLLHNQKGGWVVKNKCLRLLTKWQNAYVTLRITQKKKRPNFPWRKADIK